MSSLDKLWNCRKYCLQWVTKIGGFGKSQKLYQLQKFEKILSYVQAIEGVYKNWQFGFREKLTTSHALTTLASEISEHLNE